MKWKLIILVAILSVSAAVLSNCGTTDPAAVAPDTTILPSGKTIWPTINP